MTTARLVPVTTEMDGEELDAADAWRLFRTHGALTVLRESFQRFRYGDGFTNSRALALQACLSVVPFMLALTGLAADIDEEKPSRVVARTIQAITPGAGSSDALARAATGAQSERAGEVALWLGIVVALGTMSTAVAQVERGMNRIYGVRRDRPFLWKYGRAVVLTCVLSAPVALGFMLIVAGQGFTTAMADEYGWGDTLIDTFLWVRWPLGIVLVTFSIAVLLNHAPRRRQPALSWLATGALIGVLLTVVATSGLAAYVAWSGSFSETYGPLAGIFALLLWAQVSAMAFFYGAAVCAQLEALRGGVGLPVYADPGRPHGRVVEP